MAHEKVHADSAMAEAFNELRGINESIRDIEQAKMQMRRRADKLARSLKAATGGLTKIVVGKETYRIAKQDGLLYLSEENERKNVFVLDTVESAPTEETPVHAE